MIRTFIFLCCTTLFSFTPKHAVSQNEKIIIDKDQVLAVEEVFSIIKAQTEYRFIYYGDLFKDFPKVPLKKGEIRLNTLLNQSFSVGDLNVIVTKNNTILINKKRSNNIEQQTITGRVTDEADFPLPGATVLIKGTNRGTSTNLDGQYTIRVPDPANVLVYSYQGFKTQEITVGNQSTINVMLKEDIAILGEVTINAGYYKTTERKRTGSIAKLDAKTIEKQPVSNPLAAMQGYLPGVNITKDSGMPGGGFNIEIRGKNFLGRINNRNKSTNPLFIVDGVPFNSETLGDVSFVQSLDAVSPLNLINPSDIESIEVLKDADATAIYGSRGANGVVLITTKKGKTGKTQIKLNISTSLASVPRSNFIDLLNTEQYLDMRLEGLSNSGFTLETILEPGNFPNFDDENPDLYVWEQDRYTDWQEVFLGGTAYRKTADVSFSGGNAQTQFLFSGAYQDENTVLIGDSNYSRASVRSNINHQSNDNRFQISATTNYTADDKLLPFNRLTRLAYQLAPNAPVLYNENGDLNWENGTWENPLATLEEKFRTQSSNLLLNSVLSYSPNPNLELKVNLGYTDSHVELYRTRPHTRFNPSEGATSLDNSSVLTNNASSKSWIVEPQINWKKDWHNASLSVLMGATFQHDESKSLSLGAQGFINDSQILNLAAADITGVIFDRDSEYNYQAFFGRVNFKWTDKYIMNFTGRRDGSTRFAPGRQFGNFGALGLAWLFSEETFLEDSSVLSFGKLRTSYGITGSDSIGDYGFFDSYQTSVENYDGSTLEPARLYNPVFGWEENKKFELALELGFFQNRIMLTTAWYQNRSSNQLIGIPLPETTGFTSIQSNFDATVQNTGFEVDFRSINIQMGQFKWTTTFNISVPRNKLIKFDNLKTSTFRNIYEVGAPISMRKLLHLTGVNPDTGIYEYEDYNNDGVINFDDRQWIEPTAPNFYGGLSNTVNYKDWSLDVFFQFKKHRATLSGVRTFVPGTFFNQHISVLDRWQQPGDQKVIQQYTFDFGTEAGKAYGDNLYSNSNAIFADASFIRLRNITLTYAIPNAHNRGINASIYIQGQNLVTFTKFIGADPDQVNNFNGNLPVLQQFTMGMQLSF